MAEILCVRGHGHSGQTSSGNRPPTKAVR